MMKSNRIILQDSYPERQT